ncbi:MAG TPA: DUF5916 domain-containing protein [Longimicrobium sp.]|nr:DUF5916 domain-containing protein [Longimicrobium sp.]
MTIRFAPRVAVLAVALLAARGATAQELASSATPARSTAAAQPRAAAPGSPQRTLRAAAAVSIHVDGKLDEAAWATAPMANEFTQQGPDEGKASTERTEARVLWDGDALYVGMRMYDAHPDSILAQLTRRDEGSTSDGARVFIDSYNDKRTAFVFGINPRGVKDDFLRFDDAAGIDFGWDAVWDGAARVDSAGWTAEFRIPLSQLRFSAASVSGGRLGVNFRRYIARRGEAAFWAPIPATSNAFVSLFGELEGMQGIRQGRRLEVMPYVSSKVDRLPSADRNAFAGATTFTPSMGADLKAGLPGGLTLSATINPDFGQVEVDPAVVNLSAFETFFPERRPFFVEGADIFQFGQINTFNDYGFGQFFYSRRIGRQPQGSVRVDGVTDQQSPDATTILGAAKVSGKLGPWSIGVMNALTDREAADYRLGDGIDRRYAVEPLTNYFVGRVKRDFNRGSTVVGGMMSGVVRDLKGDEFDPYLRSNAWVGGLDAQHAWHNREWVASGYFSASRVAGSADAIARTQRSSARYFNRPDNDYVDYDTERTELGGHTLAGSLSHTGKWDASATYKEVSPGYEINDIGFMSRTDYRAFSTFIGQRVNKPQGAFRTHSGWIYHNAAWNFGGDNVFNAVGIGLNAQFKNFWYAGLNGGVEMDRWDDRSTRGGPVIRRPGGWNVGVFGNTDDRKALWFNAGVSTASSRTGGWEHAGNFGINWRPGASVQLSAGPSLTRSQDRVQWMETVEDAAATETFGNRYVFATVDRTDLAMDTRLSWTFTPTLSLQLYAQPFISANRFHDYRSLARPRSFDFNPYTGTAEGDDDFTFMSLRGNAVLRWEYRPGSALFVVWQQDRGGEVSDGRFNFGDNVSGVFDRASRNVLLIKATYWLNR